MGLNFVVEEKTGKYELVKKQIKKIEDSKDFYRKYELHEDFKGIKPY